MAHQAKQAQEQIALEAAAWSTCFHQADWYRSTIGGWNQAIKAVRVSMIALSPCLLIPECLPSLKALSETGKILESTQKLILLSAPLIARSHFDRMLKKNSLNPSRVEAKGLNKMLSIPTNFERDKTEVKMLGPFAMPQRLVVRSNEFRRAHDWKFAYRGKRKLISANSTLQLTDSLTNRDSSVKTQCLLHSPRELQDIQVEWESNDDLLSIILPSL